MLQSEILQLKLFEEGDMVLCLIPSRGYSRANYNPDGQDHFKVNEQQLKLYFVREPLEKVAIHILIGPIQA